MAKPKWRCPQCGARNDESLDRCRLCKGAMPEALRHVPPAAAPPAPAAPAPSGYGEPQDAGYAAPDDEHAAPDGGQPAPPESWGYEPEPEVAPPTGATPAPFVPLAPEVADVPPAAPEYVTPPDAAPSGPQPFVPLAPAAEDTAPYEPPYEPSAAAWEQVEPVADDAGYAPGAPVEEEPGYAAPGRVDEEEDAPVPPVGVPPVPPIGGIGTPIAAPPEPPSGPDKRVVVGLVAVGVVAILVFGVLAFSGGSKASSTLSPSETVGELLPETTARPGPDIPSENRAAVDMLPKKEDFGGLWSQIELAAGSDAFELGPNPSSAECVLPPPAVPEAGARVDLGSYVEGGEVLAQVKVFADAPSASKDVNTAPVNADITSCVQRRETARLGKLGIADFVTVNVGLDTLASPGIGEESFAYRVSITISAGSFSEAQNIDFVGWRIGRTVAFVTVSAGYGADNGPLLDQARNVFTTRFVSL